MKCIQPETNGQKDRRSMSIIIIGTSPKQQTLSLLDDVPFVNLSGDRVVFTNVVQSKIILLIVVVVVAVVEGGDCLRKYK